MDRNTILIVEDDRVNRTILKKILSAEYHICEAENGSDALSVLEQRATEISVVLLDLLMPIMDGYELIKRVRCNSRFAGVPLIVATDDAQREAEAEVLSLGANDFILKPYDPTIIRHRIANTIQLCETAAMLNVVQRDSLTGVYSKEHFYQTVNEILNRKPHRPYDMVCCDIENFKLVNDLFGTQTGDELLKYVAQAVVEALPEGSICGRMGGDVFALLVPHQEVYRDQWFAEVVWKLNRFSVDLNLVMRYGICSRVSPQVPVATLCDRANLAKQTIKGKYNAYYAYYNEELRERLLDEQSITANMNTALAQKQFKVYLQPKYHLQSGKISGAEALVRWEHPEKGLISPDKFIPLFEKNGFITSLDMYVWEEACRLLRQWLDAGERPVPISVNVSRADIYHPQLCTILTKLVENYRLHPKYLHLEITETAYTEHPVQIIETVQKLKDQGFVLEMDDFGTGYSSLNMLSELPIDVLKLDMRFVQYEEKRNSRSILSFIISLAKWLDLRVVAEGVESEEQVELLRSMSCDYVQGFYFAKPLLPEAFEMVWHRSKDKANLNLYTTVGPGKKVTQQDATLLLMVDHGTEVGSELEAVLQQDYDVLRVSKEAVAKAYLKNTEISLVLLDVTQPNETTDAFLDEFAEQGRMSHIPVIVVTTEPVSKTMVPYEEKVSDYMVTPLRPVLIKKRVQNALVASRAKMLEQEQEVAHALEEMKKRAEIDALTGLLNRSEFENRVEHFLTRNKNSDGYFIILDMDNFKLVNDNYGHIKGDEVLRQTADTLRENFFEADMLSRLGGDEFVIFIPYEHNWQELEEKVSKLCSRLSLRVGEIDVSCSAGVCGTKEGNRDYQTLYKFADMALLMAKRSGKKQCKLFDEAMCIPSPQILENGSDWLLNQTSDAVFACDAETLEIVYINDTACELVGKTKEECMGKKCHDVMWQRGEACWRCPCISDCVNEFYHEDVVLTDGKTAVHLKAKMLMLQGRPVKVHYLQNAHPIETKTP